MDKSMTLGTTRGGLYLHGKDEVYIPEYDSESFFSVSEDELKRQFVGSLLNCYRTGMLVNVRRHIAVSKASNEPQKCIFNWNGDEILLTDAELLLKSESIIYYCKSSLIYNVFKYGYKPDDGFINLVNEKFG